MTRSRRRMLLDRLRDRPARIWKGFLVAAVLLLSAALIVRLRRPQGIQEAGIVTIVEVVGCDSSNRYRNNCVHRVRFATGSEATMAFTTVVARGTKVWVSYRRFPGDDRLRVVAYAPQDAAR